MIELFSQRLAGIDTLVAHPAGMADKPLPTVLFYHGFTSSTLVYSYVAVALARAGLRCVMPDLPEHGARFDGDEGSRLRHFWHILQAGIEEFPALAAALHDSGWVDSGRLGIGGASLGGMTALGIAGQQLAPASVACLMGSGEYQTLAQHLFPPLEVHNAADRRQFAEVMAPLAGYEAGANLAALASRPLLLWHGEDDDVVPACGAQRLAARLRADYPKAALTTRWQPGVRHRITPEALAECVDFFRRTL